MMTYRKKMEELRIKSLRIIEDGLNSNEPLTAFICATQFLAYTINSDLDQPIPQEPDVLDSELIEDDR